MFCPEVPKNCKPPLTSNLCGLVTRFTESRFSKLGKMQEFRGCCGKKLELKSEWPGMTSTSTADANFCRKPSKVSRTSEIDL